MKADLPAASERRICRVLEIARPSARPSKPKLPKPSKGIDELEVRIHALAEQYPTWGYRRIWAWLRHREGVPLNRKKVYRILKEQGWFVHQRSSSPRPRIQAKRSQAEASNRRWAVDVTHIPCGRDGWAHLVAVIDCHDRELIGYEFALRGRAKEAERALEEACIRRYGCLRPPGEAPTVRSDNGLIFQSRRFRRALKDYRLSQEFITPYTPEQNGMIERFFRSLKEECTWQKNFSSFLEAKIEVSRWIEFYNQLRPHQSLGYLSPLEYRQKECQSVA